MTGRRTVIPLSLSPANPNAVLVLRALAQVPKGERSARLLEWAAGYLSGRANDESALIPEIGMSEEELDQLLDDF